MFESIPDSDIIGALEDAIQWLETNKEAWEADIYTGLLSRLAFKKHFMTAISKEPDSYLDDGTPEESFTGCTLQLALIQSTHSNGKPCPGAFSTAIQRKLASTVPPRPISDLQFDEAMIRLSRMVSDGKGALALLGVKSGLEILVRDPLKKSPGF